MLYAPWRKRYILSKKGGCFLCEAAKTGEWVIKRGKHTFIVLNIYPYNYGHVMVVPYRHISSIEELSPEERAEMMEMAAFVVKRMKEREKPPHGFNIGINLGKVAGAGLESHVHMHIVPRWEGDNNFMSVIGGERVLSFSIEEMYQELKDMLK